MVHVPEVDGRSQIDREEDRIEGELGTVGASLDEQQHCAEYGLQCDCDPSQGVGEGANKAQRNHHGREAEEDRGAAGNQLRRAVHENRHVERVGAEDDDEHEDAGVFAPVGNGCPHEEDSRPDQREDAGEGGVRAEGRRQGESMNAEKWITMRSHAVSQCVDTRVGLLRATEAKAQASSPTAMRSGSLLQSTLRGHPLRN